MSDITQRLEYLRGELRAERISYDGLHELQSLAEHIDHDDVELLEAAGVPEDRKDYETFKREFLALYQVRTGITFADGGGDEDEIKRYHRNLVYTPFQAVDEQIDRYRMDDLQPNEDGAYDEARRESLL